MLFLVTMVILKQESFINQNPRLNEFKQIN